MMSNITELSIELPWPPAELSPNSREHWTVKNKVAQEAKDYAYYETLSHRFGDWFMPETIAAIYTFHPPDDYRRRDTDNFLSRCKAYQDGIFAALDIDDSTIRETTIRWGEVTPGGKVVVRLEELK